MHEYHLARSVVNSILAKAGSLAVEKVSRVAVRVGTLKMVSAESLRRAFAEASRGTLCEDARLDVTIVEGDTLIVEQIEAEYRE